MRPLYSIPFGADFIGELASLILKDGFPLHETAIVFPGKRPALYLRRALAERIGKPFYGPAFFSMETFIDHIAKKASPASTDIEHNDAVWLLYQAVGSVEAHLRHRLTEKGFAGFYYWGQHLFAFIDQIDTESISGNALHSLEMNAAIGYDVPESVNRLLINISRLREQFHRVLEEEHLFTRGYKYLTALNALERTGFDEFTHLYFAGLFGLTGVEKGIIKLLRERGNADVIVEGDVSKWAILRDLDTYFGTGLEQIPCETRPPGRIHLHSGFDTHAEVLKVQAILRQSGSDKTAVVLPLSEALFPLLTFALDAADTPYNISLGYPLMRTPVFDLLSSVIEGQTARRDKGLYPATSYLAVMLHPFVKNLTLDGELRTLLLTLEKLLAGDLPGMDQYGSAFITLDEMEGAAGQVCMREKPTPGGTDMAGALRALKEIHMRFFRTFERAGTLHEYAEGLEGLLDFVLRHTPIRSYVLSGEIFTRTFELLEGIRATRFARETFDKREKENRQTLCDFLLQSLKTATLPFETRPVEPLEIIGVLESRSIRFDTVIMLDVNEGVMPQPKRVDPLVPLGVYEKLGIPSPEYNEEIYRYYFYRLVNAAKDVHLLYIDAADRPRSRYIEQIVWAMEKEQGLLDVLEVDKTSFAIRLAPQGTLPRIAKTDEVYNALLTTAYSPSHLDDYIRCPVLFYFKRVLKFEDRKEVTEELDALDRGKIIHQILLDTFLPYKGRQIDSSMHEALLGGMREALEREFRHRVTTGEFYLFKKLASLKLEAFLRRHLREASKPFIVTYLEVTLEASFQAGAHPIRLKGRADRIDYCPGADEYTIIDYKTGGTWQYHRRGVLKSDFRSMTEIHRSVPTFQLPLYAYLFRETAALRPSQLVNGKLIFLKDNKEEPLFKANEAEIRESIQARYVEGVETVVGEILDQTQPFTPFDDLACPACPFNLLCHV